MAAVVKTSAQNISEKNFDFYSTASGMSNNTINGIAQDKTGYIWIATASGLNRFNGSRFVQFHSNNDSLSISAEDLKGMYWLDSYRLAVFTSGVHIVDTRTGMRHNLFIPYHDLQFQYKFNMIERAIGDDDGNVYVLSRSGFYHFDKNYKLVSRFDYYTDAEVLYAHFYFGRDLYELDNDRLLIISIDGLYIYNKKNRKVKKMTAEDCPVLAGYLDYPQTYYTFFQSKPGNLFVLKLNSDSLVYINTIENKKTVSYLPFNPGNNEFHWRSRMYAAKDNLFYITGHNAGFYKMQFFPVSGKLKFYGEKYFSSYLCSSLLEDKEGNLWVGTNKGLFRQNPQKAQVQSIQLPDSLEKLFPNILLDDIFVTDDKVYAGSRQAGLFIFDKKSLQFEEQVFLKNKNIYSNNIRAILPIDHSTLMLGTGGPLFLFDKKTRKAKQLAPSSWNVSTDWTSDMNMDDKGNIWILSNIIHRYDPRKKTFSLVPNFGRLLNVPYVAQKDKDGHIWMSGHGIARYNTSQEKFDIFLDSFPYVKMPDKQINFFFVDERNTLWINSNNNGLVSYNISEKKFRHFTKSNGLPDDNIGSMIEVDNRIWMATYSGLACLDLKTLQIISFGKEDGFPEMPVFKGARFFYDKELKQLYIGMGTSVVRFNPNDILRKKSPPHTFIENLVINGKRIKFHSGQPVSTSWKNNDIRITIGTINFSDGNIQRFAYRIVNDDSSSWTLMGVQPSFNISSLSPGTHRIQVKAYAPDNRWPEQIKEMSIVVLPPVWKTDWFLIIASFVFLVFLYLFIKWRTGLARKKEMEKTHIEKLKADDYKNQFELEQISNYFSSSLSGKKTEDEVLWDVAQNLIGRMNYEDCIIYLWNEDRTKMIQKAAYGPKGKPEFISEQLFEVLPGQGIVGHVINTMQPMLVNDTRKDPRYRVDDTFRLSEICVPIIHDDELLGIIDSEHHDAGYFSERDIKILTTIATLIGNKLKQLESEQSLDVKQKELANINEQLAEARLTALQAQMNPHFVFNALNSIKRMILDGDNEKASRYLSKFALMIRMTLNHSRDIFVTLDENIEYLEAYLEMEKLRFDDSFGYSITVDENIDVTETAIPSMMIQPLVENAIWHGLMQAINEKMVRVSFAQADNRIFCSVEDNGIGIRQSEKLKEKNKSPHHSMGLENLQKRIKIINEKYGIDLNMQILDLKENGNGQTGTKVILQFNLINT